MSLLGCQELFHCYATLSEWKHLSCSWKDNSFWITVQQARVHCTTEMWVAAYRRGVAVLLRPSVSDCADGSPFGLSSLNKSCFIIEALQASVNKPEVFLQHSAFKCWCYSQWCRPKAVGCLHSHGKQTWLAAVFFCIRVIKQHLIHFMSLTEKTVQERKLFPWQFRERITVEGK